MFKGLPSTKCWVNICFKRSRSLCFWIIYTSSCLLLSVQSSGHRLNPRTTSRYYIGLFRSEHAPFLYNTDQNGRVFQPIVWGHLYFRIPSTHPYPRPHPSFSSSTFAPTSSIWIPSKGELIKGIGKIRRPGRVSGKNIRDEPASSASAEPSNTEESSNCG